MSVLLIPEAWDPECALGSQDSVNTAVAGRVDGSWDLHEEY